MTGEFELIERLKKMIPRSLQGGSLIGDDAGFLPRGKTGKLFVTTDMIVEGVDFRLGRGGAAPQDIGHKALAINLSDCAAMGGRPIGFVAALGIPKHFSVRFIEGVARGIIRLARKFRVAWVGGDLSGSKQLVISIALLGEPFSGKGILRSGARPGDPVFVTGTLGGSIRRKHLSFTPRLREAEFLAKRFRPSALIDISDGFIQDLGHLLTASRVGARINLDAIPISPTVLRMASSSLLSPQRGERERVPRVRVRGDVRKSLYHALTDGEDFELLGTISKIKWCRLEKAWKRRFPTVRLSRVGEITGKSSGVEWQTGKRSFKKLWFRKKGFAHF